MCMPALLIFILHAYDDGYFMKRFLINRIATARFAKFLLVGGAGVIVNNAVLFLLTEIIGITYKISGLIAIETAIINNFVWNYTWTWSDRKAKTLPGKLHMLAKFNVSSGLVAFLVNYSLLRILTDIAGMYYLASNIIGILCGTAANYALSHFWTFRIRKSV
ncbi:MAG: hypothetical protein GF398_16760 [Chitinivibrionales bacterium]|nr:hypothetical protein [Chitinivibrionales bacterium]